MSHQSVRPQQKHLSQPKQLLFGLGLVAGSVLAGLLLVEALLRIINPHMTYAYMPQEIYVSHFRASPFLPHELRPNNHSRFKMLEFDTTVITNSIGLRDNEVDFSKPRILCMGDSFTFGFGVENKQTFCAILEDLFQGRYDFVNTAYADGYSPDTYALWLTKYGAALDPTTILVSFFQNDLNEPTQNLWLKGGGIMSPADSGFPDKIVKPGVIVTEDGVGIRDNVIAKLPPSFRRLLKKSYLVGFVRDRILDDASGPSQPAHADSASVDAKFIRSLEMLHVAAGQYPLVFYIIPGDHQTGPSHMDQLIQSFAAQHQIPVLINFQDFTQEDFFKLDAHWKPKGHQKAAEFLHQALTQIGY